MKNHVFSAVVAACVLTGTARAAESVQFKDLPPAVQETINSHVGAAGISSIQPLTRHGIPLYEVRLSRPGSQPLYVSATGSVIDPDQAVVNQPTAEGSRKVTFAELPRPVQNTIRSQAGNARIEDIDAVTRQGRTTYEAAFKRGDETVELLVDEGGTLLSGGQAAAAAASLERVPLSAATKVTLDQLPERAQKTLQSYALGARIEDIDKGTLQGRTVYQAAFKHAGRNIELRVGEDGSLLRDDVNDRYLALIQGPSGRRSGPSRRSPPPDAVGSAPSWQTLERGHSSGLAPLNGERRVRFNQVPAAVQKALRAQAGTASIERITLGTIDGQHIYEGTFQRDGRNTVVRVKPDGTLLP